MNIYLVLKHPRLPYGTHTPPRFMDAALVVSAHQDAATAKQIADNKNKHGVYYFYSVQRKQVKP